MGRGRYVGAATLSLLIIGASASACGTTYTTADGPDGSVATSDAAAVDGGFISRPGLVECGSTDLCDKSKNGFCCVSAGSPEFQCDFNDSDCTSNRVLCDEAADCPTGQSCCATISLGSFATVCQSTCSLEQSCRSDAECGSQKCVKQSCTGLVGWLCGLSVFCTAL